MTRDEIIIDGLDSKLSSINYIIESLDKTAHDNRDYSILYQEISYFIHYIIKTEELRKLFTELLLYFDRISENGDYTKALDNINTYVKSISDRMLTHADFSNFKSAHNYGFKNPFFQPMTLNVEDLLKSFKQYSLTPKGPLNTILDDTFAVLIDIYNKWIFSHKNGFEDIINELNLLSASINSISFFEEFEHDYLGVKSANNLVSIYKSLNPTLGLQGSTFVWFQNDMIQKGKGIYSKKTLLNLKNDCYKLYHYLKQRLTTGLSIETAIDRFSTYMSLYYRETITGSQPEKEMQRKFEEFIFQSGYYPISEAQVKDGRIDTLILDNSNSFLAELKQVDLGKTDETDTAIDNKFSSAQIQSSIYVNSLKALPNLGKDIFVILFTNRKVTFKNNIDRVEKDSLRFIFKSVGIFDDSASKIKDEYEVDIQTLIQ